MSNKIVNPIIQHHTSDTLYFASGAMAYIWESINELEFAEISFEARQGLCSLIQCACQAINYEAGRAYQQESEGDDVLIDEDKQSRNNELSLFEKELITDLCEQLKSKQSGDSSVVSLSKAFWPRKN